MKPFFLLFLPAFLLPAASSAQSALLDAQRLREYLIAAPNQRTVAKFSSDAAAQADYLPILRQYAGTEVGDDQDLIDAFFDNPYLGPEQGKSIVLLPDEYHDVVELMADGRGGRMPGVPSPGMFVTNLADGLASFLVKRTRQELSITFFRDFQRQVKNNIYLQQLFPETAVLLESIGTEIYQFKNYLGALRASYVQDLNVLPANLQRGIEQYRWVQDPAMEILAKDLLGLGQMLVDGERPVDFIRYLGQDAYIQQATDRDLVTDTLKRNKLLNLAGAFQTVQLVSGSLRSDKPGQDWLTGREIEAALSDRWTLYLYLGLLYQQAQPVQFAGTTDLRMALTNASGSLATLDKVKRSTARFADNGQMMQRTLLSMPPETDSASRYEAVYQYLNRFFTLLETGLEIRQTLLPNPLNDTLERQFLADLRQLSNLNLNIRQKRYVLAVNNVSYILTRLLGDQLEDEKKHVFFKYSMFIASVAEADNPDAIQTAIELFAMPPGGSTLKKHSRFSLSLNAYTGLAYGTEKLEESGDGEIMSITAPVGIGLNWGLGRRIGSLSFYSPILDVGAITAYRFDDANTESLPALEWQNILSPGAFVVYGMGWDIPISIGFGAQMGPNLRKVNTGGQVDITDRGWRVVGFIGVDIPIAHFYTRR